MDNTTLGGANSDEAARLLAVRQAFKMEPIPGTPQERIANRKYCCIALLVIFTLTLLTVVFVEVRIDSVSSSARHSQLAEMRHSGERGIANATDEIQTEVDILEGKVTKLETEKKLEIENLSAKISKMELAASDCRSNVSTLTSSLRDATSKIRALQLSSEDLSLKFTQTKAFLTNLHENCTRGLSMLLEMRGEIPALSARSEKYEQDISMLNRSLEVAKNTQTKLETLLEMTDSGLKDLRSSALSQRRFEAFVASTSEQIEELKDTDDRMSSSLGNSSEELGKRLDAFEEISNERFLSSFVNMSDLQASMSDAQTDLARVNFSVASMDFASPIKCLLEKVENFETYLDSAANERRNISTSLTRLHSSVTEANNRFDSLNISVEQSASRILSLKEVTVNITSALRKMRVSELSEARVTPVLSATTQVVDEVTTSANTHSSGMNDFEWRGSGAGHTGQVTTSHSTTATPENRMHCPAALEALRKEVDTIRNRVNGTLLAVSTEIEKIETTINQTIFTQRVMQQTLSRQVEIRLVGVNSTAKQGRVEVYYSGRWGTICDDGWDINDARVVCRKLGFDRAVAAPKYATFGPGETTIWLDNLSCSGGEDSLHSCSGNGWGVHDCGHHEDASVICD